MARLLLFCFLLGIGKLASAQFFHSDHNTPLIELSNCNCSTWRSTAKNVDSTRRKLKEVRYDRDGGRYRRTYYVTTTDTTLTEICDGPGNCAGTARTRVSSGFRTWFTDVSTAECNLLSFTLPACSDKMVYVRDIATVNYTGNCQLVFTPAVLRVPDQASRTENVTVSIGGKTLTASITMINPASKSAANSADQDKLRRLNETATAQYKPVMERAVGLMAKSLSGLGEWRGEEKQAFAYRGEASVITCTNTKECFTNSYKINGEGTAGFAGRLVLPVSGLPMLNKFFTAGSVPVNISASMNLNTSDQTTCTNNEICSTGDGAITGNGTFSLRSAGYRANGQIVLEGGSLKGGLCLWPQVKPQCTNLVSGQLKITGTVEDKWGLTHWDVNYTLWNGFAAPLTDCKQ